MAQHHLDFPFLGQCDSLLLDMIPPLSRISPITIGRQYRLYFLASKLHTALRTRPTKAVMSS